MNPADREFLIHPDMVGRLRRRGAAMVADNATVVGDVRLGRDVGVWFGVTIRGDDSWIEIGEESNAAESCGDEASGPGGDAEDAEADPAE